MKPEIPSDELFEGYITLRVGGAMIQGRFVHESLALLFIEEIKRLRMQLAIPKPTSWAPDGTRCVYLCYPDPENQQQVLSALRAAIDRRGA